MADDSKAIVNKYLLYVEDPSSIVDADAIKEAESAVDAATTAADKLIALSELERLKDGDPTELEASFVAVARDWGDENNVTVGAWQALGVPAGILAKAKITTGFGQAAKATRSRRVSRDAVIAEIPDTPFTIKELSEMSGAASGTVTAVVKELLASNRIKDVGKAEQSGQGRAATQYKKV